MYNVWLVVPTKSSSMGTWKTHFKSLVRQIFLQIFVRFSSKVVISLTSPKVMHQNVFLDLFKFYTCSFCNMSNSFHLYIFSLILPTQIRSETAKILKATYPLAFNMTLAIFGNRLFDVCMIITYTLTTSEIKASTIFVVISLCNTLRGSFGRFFPQALQLYQENTNFAQKNTGRSLCSWCFVLKCVCMCMTVIQ